MSLTDSQRRANGQRRLVVWLPEDALEKLDAICEQDGEKRPRVIEQYIRQEWEEREALRGRTRGKR